MPCYKKKKRNKKSRRLSGKLHCLNFVFPAENEILYPVYFGRGASSPPFSLSMPKVPKEREKISILKTRELVKTIKHYIRCNGKY